MFRPPATVTVPPFWVIRPAALRPAEGAPVRLRPPPTVRLPVLLDGHGAPELSPAT